MLRRLGGLLLFVRSFLTVTLLIFADHCFHRITLNYPSYITHLKRTFKVMEFLSSFSTQQIQSRRGTHAAFQVRP